MLRIVPFPHPALRFESRPVDRIDDALRSTIREMFDLMYEHRGIGLAANQVGIPQRFFILNLTADPDRKEEEQVFINPEITKRHGSFEAEEGCLSFPGLYAKVQRARKVRVLAYDLNGAPIDVEAHDLFSRAIQHENDHLLGKLFIDYLAPGVRSSLDAKIKEIERSYREDQQQGRYPSDEEIARQLAEFSSAVVPASTSA